MLKKKTKTLIYLVVRYLDIYHFLAQCTDVFIIIYLLTTEILNKITLIESSKKNHVRKSALLLLNTNLYIETGF